MGDAKNVAESAKKVEDVTSFLKKGLSAKADVKNVMNVVSVRQLLEMGGGKGDIWVSLAIVPPCAVRYSEVGLLPS